jgi:hypothetical protein
VKNDYALPFPEAQQPSQNLCSPDLNIRVEPGGDGCGCTTQNVINIGFPFRINNYDACQNDDKIDWFIEAINVAIQLSIAFGVFFLSKRLFRSR